MEHLQRSSDKLVQKTAHIGAEDLELTDKEKQTSSHSELDPQPSSESSSHEHRIQRLEDRLAEIEKSEDLRSRQSENSTNNELKRLATGSQTTLDPDLLLTSEVPGSSESSDARLRVRYERLDQLIEDGKYMKKREVQGPLGSELTPEGTARKTNPADDELGFTEYYNKAGKREKTEVTIRSDPLRKLIQEIMQPLLEHERSKVWNSVPVVIPARNVLVLHSWDALRAAADSDAESCGSTKRARELLRRFLHAVGIYESEILKARDTARQEGVVAYSNMWILFPPGSEVIASPVPDSRQIFTLQRHAPKKSGSFAFLCHGYDWNGKDLITNSYEFIVSEYDNEKKVWELPCYPIRFHRFAPGPSGEDEQGLRDALTERGKRFLQYSRHSGLRPRLFCDKFYTTMSTKSKSRSMSLLLGVFLDEIPPEPIISVPDGQSPKEIVIDASLYKKYAPGAQIHGMPLGQKLPLETGLPRCGCSLCRPQQKHTQWEERLRRNSHMPPVKDKAIVTETDEDDIPYFQLPPRVLGYSLGEKAWGQIHVDNIRGPEPEESPRDKIWDSLSMGKKHKENIRKMIKNHLDSDPDDKNRIRDLVPKKGEGLVLLLHGVPGVGKTMTAEGLSVQSDRRLLKIDAAEFAYNDPAQVSDVFQKYFDYSESWGALILLDEADVFLQMRGPTGMDQNALVAVLLRQLEYFRGVLILTTNRIKTIDNAVQSRIHYAVNFKPLDEAGISTICKTFLNQLREGNCEDGEKKKIKDHLDDEDVRNSLISLSFTGRDIRNMFTAAQMLDYPNVSLDALKQVISSTKMFREGLRDQNTSREAALNIM